MGELVARRLTDAGMDVRTGLSVTTLRRPGPTGPVTLTLDDGTELEVDEVIFATGRTPNTDDIGLETVGLAPGSWLDVDNTCRVRGTDGEWLYALGDVNHRALLTHQGKYQARIAGDAIAAAAAGRRMDHAPWVRRDHRRFTCRTPSLLHRPRSGRGGTDREQADHAGHRVRVVDFNIGESVSAPIFTPTTTQGPPAWSSTSTGILSVTLVGPGVCEFLHSATVAVAARVPVDRLWHAVPCFPTISEVWLRLMGATATCRRSVAHEALDNETSRGGRRRGCRCRRRGRGHRRMRKHWQSSAFDPDHDYHNDDITRPRPPHHRRPRPRRTSTPPEATCSLLR